MTFKIYYAHPIWIYDTLEEEEALLHREGSRDGVSVALRHLRLFGLSEDVRPNSWPDPRLLALKKG
jgi:hypothetical protein